MADYYAILKRAVDALPDSTREQRQAVYDKARNALLKQLQGMNPPLPPAEISKQRVALEEAVRSVERDLMLESEAENGASSEQVSNESVAQAPAASAPEPKAPIPSEAATPKKAPTVSVSDSSPAPESKAEREESEAAKEPLESEDRVVRRAGQDVLKNAVRDAEKLGTATSAAVKSAQETADMVGDQRKGESSRIEPTLGEAVVSSSKTYKAASPAASVSADADKGSVRSSAIAEEEKSSGFATFALVAVVAIVLGGSSYLLYQNKGEFLGLTDDSSSVEKPAEKDGTSEPAQTAEDKPAAKDEMVAKNVRTVTVTPDQDGSQQNEASSSDQNQQPDQSAAQSSTGSETATQAPSEQAPVVGDQVAKVDETAIQAIFYEENAAEGSDGQASPGQTIWNLEGEGEDAVVSIAVDVPKREISFMLRMSKNKDASLPASHLIEIEISKRGASEDLKVSEIPGLIMKPTEGSRGQGLFGEPVRIADDLHWIALNASEKALRYNLELLELRQWIDMPILFQSGRRGILTLKKGDSGNTVMESALRQWSK